MKTNNFNLSCWILITLFLFVACKTTQKSKPCNDCPSFSTVKIPYIDTIIFDEMHNHIYLDGQNHCLYVESFTTVEVDTIYLELLKPR